MKRIILYVVIICIIFYIGLFKITKKIWENQNRERISQIKSTDTEIQNTDIHIEDNNMIDISNNVEKEIGSVSNVITDWKLILVNYQNSLPKEFEIDLAYIDDTRQFDSRAITELKQMLKDMKESGASNIWVQSAYRSVEYQEGLFNAKINYYIQQGKTRSEAESLTLQTINRPGTSEHNLGLAVDFNYVNNDFENTKEFKWLQENAEEYGFILRYKEEKENITKVTYEPWHWRYVGVENAKKMNELDMCLEEYIDYLKNI